MEALCVTEQIFTVGRAPEDLVKEKSDSRLGAKHGCEPRRDAGEPCGLRPPLPAQFGNELEPAFGARLGKADDLSIIQDR